MSVTVNSISTLAPAVPHNPDLKIIVLVPCPEVMLHPVIPACDGVMDHDKVNKLRSRAVIVEIVFPGVLHITLANGGFGSPIEQDGNGFTVTVPIAGLATHPFAAVTVTVYTVVAFGATLIVDVVAPPGDHKYVKGPTPPCMDAVNVTGFPPGHITSELTVT